MHIVQAFKKEKTNTNDLNNEHVAKAPKGAQPYRKVEINGRLKGEEDRNELSEGIGRILFLLESQSRRMTSNEVLSQACRRTLR